MKTSARRCDQLARNGTPCRMPALKGRTCCRFHGDPEAHRAMSRRGGKGKAPALPFVGPLAEDPAVQSLELLSATELPRLLAATLRRLTLLPFDVRVANAISQVVQTHRAAIETGELEERLRALENPARPQLVG